MKVDYKFHTGGAHVNPRVVNIRCPICNNNGSFHGAPDVNDFGWQQNIAEPGKPATPNNIVGGIRICPNPQCRAVVFIVIRNGALVRSFPPQTLDFDATNLPQLIKDSLTEAIKCHSAECFKAAALMVRRTLEELCQDKKATGGDLKARLQSLGKNILVPQDLLEAADELRLLGNDAAHIEAKSYDAIGEAEATLAIELAKELLKAAYQYSSLVDKLKALKKTP
jgi:hypothetical protein